MKASRVGCCDIAADDHAERGPVVDTEQRGEQTAGIEDGLLDPAAYPWRPVTVERIETHVSWVFFAGDRVVKVKRPVVYPFVDHRTLTARHQSCLDEVRLNRRLTDGVYLGVVPVV